MRRMPSSRRYRTAALLSLTLDIDVLADMVSIGTLFAFMYDVAAPLFAFAFGQRLTNDDGRRYEYGINSWQYRLLVRVYLARENGQRTSIDRPGTMTYYTNRFRAVGAAFSCCRLRNRNAGRAW